MAAPASEPLRVRVAALVLIDGKVVLVRHRRGDATYHLLPGGGVEAGESIAEALVREVAEETGLAVAIERPLAISDSIDPHGQRHVVNVVFVASAIGGELRAPADNPRIEAVELADPSDLPRLDLRPPMGEFLAGAIASGFDIDTRYLGSLWVEAES